MKALRLCLLPLILAGCAEQYVAPPNAPQAKIRSELDATDSWQHSLILGEQAIVNCGKYDVRMRGRRKAQKQFFSINGKTSDPVGYIAVEAGKPLHLAMEGRVGSNRGCEVGFVTEFTPGHRYVFKGGIVEDPSIGRNGCFMNIFDDDTGAPLAKIKESVDKCDLKTTP